MPKPEQYVHYVVELERKVVVVRAIWTRDASAPSTWQDEGLWRRVKDANGASDEHHRSHCGGGGDPAWSEGVPSRDEILTQIDALVEEQRPRCFWSVRLDWRPHDDVERRRALAEIQKHGDRAAFVRAGELDAWLSRISSAASAE